VEPCGSQQMKQNLQETKFMQTRSVSMPYTHTGCMPSAGRDKRTCDSQQAAWAVRLDIRLARFCTRLFKVARHGVNDC
jgi:hypothetical protein